MTQLLLTRKESADTLRLSVRMIDKLIGRGELSPRRIGRRVLLPREAVERFARGEVQGNGSMALNEASA